MPNRLFSFLGGNAGAWRVTGMAALVGEPLAMVSHMNIVAENSPGADDLEHSAVWILRGITSNERYVTRAEKEQLVAAQQELGRKECTLAAVIPIRKNPSWWALTQDERRDILAGQSKHVRIGLQYLPGIARRLHHCRDLSENEPFDFVTLFDYAPWDENSFNELLAELRASPEWAYVEREVDIRLIRD